MHKTPPNTTCKILTAEIAVPADAPDGEVRDEISALLTEHGIANSRSLILDWQYTGEERLAQAGDDPEEGEVFRSPAVTEILSPRRETLLPPSLEGGNRTPYVYVGRKKACGCCVGVATDTGNAADVAQDIAEFIAEGLAVTRVSWAEYQVVAREPTFMDCPHGQLAFDFGG